MMPPGGYLSVTAPVRRAASHGGVQDAQGHRPHRTVQSILDETQRQRGIRRYLRLSTPQAPPQRSKLQLPYCLESRQQEGYQFPPEQLQIRGCPHSLRQKQKHRPLRFLRRQGWPHQPMCSHRFHCFSGLQPHTIPHRSSIPSVLLPGGHSVLLCR